jgi:FAD/FMN-containing dehydrogenase
MKRSSPPPLDGELCFDQRARAAAAEDFGHLVHRVPAGVLLPASEEDVATAVGWAAAHGHTFAAQGQRHSVFGRGQVGDGIVADLRRLRAIHGVQHDRVVVDAGATWSEVVAATLPQGLAPPVLTDYLELSVGGTLVVGGVGATTWRLGVQSDQVLELQVVTGRGERLTCSPDRNPGLFDAVRAGLGQVGVITRATLRLVPAPRQVRRFLLSYDDLATMLGDQRLLIGEHRFEGCRARCWPPRPAAGGSGSTWPRSSPGPRRRTGRCWAACPMTGRGRSRARCPTSTTSSGSARWSSCCEPTASGGSRIPG